MKNRARLLGLFGLLIALLATATIINPTLIKLSGAALNLSTVSCAEITQISMPECLALEALYSSTNGASWGNHSGWFTTITPCDWYGIGCLENAVISIILDSNQLAGSLPAELSNLGALQTISLGHNQITGQIPVNLGLLHNLHVLDLSYNRLTGSIPGDLAGLRNLIKLHLHVNLLTGIIPDQLGNLTNMEELFLQYNNFGAPIPSSLSNITNLKILRLQNSSLIGEIPVSLGSLEGLQELNLSNNQLTGAIPEQLGNLDNLNFLYLYNNNLEYVIPDSFSNLDSLLDLNLMNNMLTGEIPRSLGELANLEYLNLSGNQLNGPLPAALGSLSSLQILILRSNELAGGIPASLGDISGLKTLDISYNAFEGDIPPSLTRLLESSPDIWNYMSFGYNRLSAKDETLILYLNMNDPYWEVTQTVSPTNLKVEQISTTSVNITWEPILYKENAGYYEISIATSSDGSYSVHGITRDKTTREYQLVGLVPDSDYYIRIRTFTPAHDNQTNDLWSEYTPPLLLKLSLEFPTKTYLYLPLIRR